MVPVAALPGPQEVHPPGVPGAGGQIQTTGNPREVQGKSIDCPRAVLKTPKKKVLASSTLEPPESASRRVTAVGHRPTGCWLSANRRRLGVNRRRLSVNCRRLAECHRQPPAVQKKRRISSPKDSPGLPPGPQTSAATSTLGPTAGRRRGCMPVPYPDPQRGKELRGLCCHQGPQRGGGGRHPAVRRRRGRGQGGDSAVVQRVHSAA